MPTMKIRFPGGRYHATPWGHHVNEGLIEWPPCPWRLLRALIATGYAKLGWDGAVPDTGRRLIEALAGTLPKYHLPPASGAHSRHYMPVCMFKKPPAANRTEFEFAATTVQRADLHNYFTEDTALVFDTWANVGEGELLICWDCTLDDQAKVLFGQLVRHLGYLGRSESWVEAEPVDDAEVDDREINAYPHPEGHNPGPGWEQVSLMAAENPAQYIAWREQAVEQAQGQAERSVREAAETKKKAPPKSRIKKARDKATVPYPTDLLDCLQRDTAWWKQHRWSQPPGSRRVIYWRRADALEVSPPVQRGQRPVKRESQITVMLLALTTPSGNRSALPHVSRTLPQAELLHDAAVRRAGNGHPVDCPELIGKDRHGKPLRDGHRHAHVLPLDLDRDQHIDHILVYAPMGLGDHARHAIRTLRRTWTKGGVGELQLALVGEGDLNALHRIPAPLNQEVGRLLGHRDGTRRWISLTPFVAPRYEKKAGKKNDLMCQVNAELISRRMPAAEVHHLAWNRRDIRSLRHFVRRRQRGDLPPRDIGYALALTFAEPVRGPIALGYGCHFGLGLFIAQQHG